MQKNYEIIYSAAKKETKDKVRKKVNHLIKKIGGKIIEETSLSKEKFAYPIKKQSSGYFLITCFSALPQNIKKLNTKLRLQKEILRFMITTKKEIKEKMVLPKKEKIEKKPTPIKKTSKEEKAAFEEIDKKIDEILKENIA